MYYKKRFDFYNAPLDRVNVAATRAVLDNVLSYSLAFSIGRNVNTSDATIAAINTEMSAANFEETQTTLFVPYKNGSDAAWLKVNYLRVSFFAGTSTNTQLYRFFFVDGVEICDTDDAARRYYKLTLSPDLWHTYIIGGTNAPTATLYGGTLTRSGALTEGLNAERTQWDAPAGLPFNPTSFAIEESDIFPAFDTFRAVVQITGKDLERALLLVSRDTKNLRGALADAQAFAVSRKIRKTTGSQTTEFEEGEYKVQGAYVVPFDLLPLEAFGDDVWSVFPKGAGSIPDRFFVETVGTGDAYAGGKRRFRLGLGELVQRMGYNALANAANNEVPYPFARRVTVGTLFNRIDITEFVCRGKGLPYLDTVFETVFGLNSFNITMATSTSGTFKDITEDFKVFSLVDPESEYIRANKTNAVLAGIGSISQIATGAATLKASPAAGISLITGGISGLVGTATSFQTATTAPNVIQSSGYGDVTGYLGGVFYSVSSNTPEAWGKLVKSEGVERKIQLSGAWNIDLNAEEDGAVFVNPFAVAGASVRDVPAVVGDGIAAILTQGVRLWYNAYALRDMEF